MKSRLFALVASAALMATALTSAQTFTDLAAINCSTDGCGNQQGAPLAQGRDGNLYGQSYSGGTDDDGAVWGVTPSGSISALWSFTEMSSKNIASGGPTLGLDGNFYGVTGYGGANNVGFIYKITPGGVLTDVHDFNVNVDTGINYLPLVLGSDGNFYSFGAYNPVWYKFTTAGKFSVVAKTAPTFPQPLILASNGTLYGVSYSGGTANDGYVFSVTTAGKIKTIYNFSGTEGQNPVGALVQGSDGYLYGVTQQTSSSASTGTIYKISTAGKFTLLSTFPTDGSFGANIEGGLVAATDGNFYGNTTTGGTNNTGTVFKMTPSGTLTVLHDFSKACGDPGNAWLPLTARTDGTLYGLQTNGCGSDGGEIYTLSDTTFKPFIIVQNYSAKSGGTIDILGNGFIGATAVDFGSIPATSFNVVSSTFMTAVVSPDAITGTVSVTTPSGKISSLRTVPILPTIQSFTPTSGPVGQLVTITGTGFTGASKVTFGGVKATSFTVVSATEITATVPTGAKTGVIAVTTAGGSGSKGTFTVN
jgi:uncharacterized repeat protein (TIGR03803 family)